MKAKHLLLIGGGAVAVYALTRPKAMEVIGEAAGKAMKAIKGGPSPEIVAACQNAAAQAGVPASWIMAIADHEGGFKTNAIATNPADLAHGGSYGMFQMTYDTAKGLGYKGPAPNPLPQDHPAISRAIKALRPAWPTPEKWWTKTVEGKAAANVASKIVQRALDDKTWVPFRSGEGLLNPTTQFFYMAKLIKDNLKRWKVNTIQDVAALHNSGVPYAKADPSVQTGYVPKVVAKEAKWRKTLVI